MLFVSPRFLFPADSGGKIRTRDVLRGMKGGRFQITLASPEPNGGATQFAGELARVCDRFVGWAADGGLGHRLRRWAALASPLPVAVASDRSAAGRRAISAEVARKPDVVVVDFPHSTMLMPEHLDGASVLFTHNIEAEIFRRHADVAPNPVLRAVWMDQARKMRKFEDAAAARYDGLVAVSDRDARHFRSLVGEKRVHIIPTGVDLDYFQFAPADRIVPANGGTLVFTGSMDWRANVDGIRFFMDAVWPQIASARPQARMIVVGHSPPRDLVAAVRDRRLAWEFTGFVDDVRTRMREADLYVIPLRVGGGTRIKAFEAMAMGCPVVSTSLGVEGLPVEHGTHCVIADSAPALARAILDLFADAPARSEIARRARALLDERFSFRAAAAVFEEACIRTVDARHGMQMRPLRSRRS